MRRSTGGLVAVAACVAAACSPCLASRLPVRSYTTKDGLPCDKVTRIVEDSRGFLWLATCEGLSRFDGRTFRSFGAQDGLPDGEIGAIAESAGGDLIVGTESGLARLAGGAFEVLHPGVTRGASVVHALARDLEGALWIGTADGLYRTSMPPGSVSFERVGTLARVLSLHAGPDGIVWCGTVGQVVGIGRDGETRAIVSLTEAWDTANELTASADGTIWVASRIGLARFDPRAGAHPPLTVVYAPEHPRRRLPFWTNQVSCARDGTLYAVGHGLRAIVPGDGRRPDEVRVYGPDEGLCGETVESVLADREGNLWLGSQGCGLMRIEPKGIETFDLKDGIPTANVIALTEDAAGGICALESIELWHCRENERFVTVRPRGIAELPYPGWAAGQAVARDASGGWWLAAGSALMRYRPTREAAKLAATSPLATSRSDGDVFRVFTDSRGGIWVALLTAGGGAIEHWDPGATRARRVPAGGGDPLGQPTALAEDARGTIWVGTSQGRLYRGGVSVLQRVTVAVDKAPDEIRSISGDTAGRLWIATGRTGLFRIDDPSAPEPQAKRYGRAEGLGSEHVLCAAPVANGRIGVGTTSGFALLDPGTERVRRFTTEDGLASDWISVVRSDAEGRVWIGTPGGLSSLDPAPGLEPEPAAARTLVTALTIDGRPHAVSALGTSAVEGIEVGPGEATVEIAATGLGLGGADRGRFQHRLGDGPWSTPSEEPVVTLAATAPGRYRVEIRAVRADGTPAGAPAAVAFRVRPRFWRTAWFGGLVALLVAGAVVAAHRSRVARAVATERMRTRIATDLHDDVGTSLSQIALRSELALARLEGHEAVSAEALEGIAAKAREAVDAVSDAVWSIEPRHDQLADLVGRIRAFSLEAERPGGPAIALDLPEHPDGLKLDPDRRRQVYLVFKESFTNALRHARAQRIDIALRWGSGSLELTVADDGRGLGTSEAGRGHGLASLERRAAALGGRLEIASPAAGGTAVRLIVPLL